MGYFVLYGFIHTCGRNTMVSQVKYVDPLSDAVSSNSEVPLERRVPNSVVSEKFSN